ncbi:MAG TPA: DUF2177 family protein [Rhizomicrobium sp.]|jgi:uncharacterized membrane protein|nr:DUF2177 family protein [Rhizomicrobium sp.]
MNRNLVAYVAAAIVLFGLDMVWLSTTAQSIYQAALGGPGGVMSGKFNLTPVVIFYLLYPVGLVYFAVLPALRGGGWTTAIVNGALFGFFAYMTYDMTNMASLKVWSWRVSAIDVAWGTVLNGAAATASYFLTRIIAGTAA